MTTQLVELKQDLKKFGLNPSDWKIQPVKKSKFKIAHHQDSHFYFIGKASPDGLLPKWQEIYLASC